MENNIDLTKSTYYIKLDIDTSQSLRIFERMGFDLDKHFKNDWFKEGFLGHRNINDDNTLFVDNKQLLNIPHNSGYKPVDFDSLSKNQPQKDIPLYNMSDIQRHYKEIDKNGCACYFLEPGKDKYALDKVKSLGYDRISNLTNDGISLKEKDVILIIKNEAYIHPNPDDIRYKNTCLEMKDLLTPTGITDIQNIPRYKLDDFLNQEKKDIKDLESHYLCAIPINRRTEAVCMKALNQRIVNIKDIPDYYFTDKRIEQILNIDSRYLTGFPISKLNEERCLDAIEKDSATFLYMPEEARTEKVCMAAYEQARNQTGDHLYLMSIVEKIPHSNACIELLNKYANNVDFETILISIPDKVFNQEIAEVAVKLHPDAISDIRENYISEKMVHTALKADPYLISSVPDRYKTLEMCEEILFTPSESENPYSIFRATPYPELIMEALLLKEYEKYPIVAIASSIQPEVMNRQIAEELVKRDSNCLKHIPFHLKDEAICLEAIKGAKRMDSLYAIPRDSMTDKVCQELVNRFPQVIGHILPESKKTPEICLKAVINNDTLQRYVPEYIRNSKEMNIYKFGILATKQLPGLDFDQIKDLYQGKKIEVNYPIPENQRLRTFNVQYDPQKKSLEYSNIPLVKHKEIARKPNLNTKSKGMKL